MTRRAGASLAGVLFFCLAAASVSAWLLMVLIWSYESLTAVAFL